MSNALFPSLIGLTFPVEKTPVWSTKIQPCVSGKETRLNMWTYPIWQYEIGYDVLRSDNVHAELQTLVGFFNARRGAFDDFLFLDPDDFSSANQTFALGDGTTVTFQLARAYGGVTEPVRAVSSITNVKINSTTTAAYTINANAGTITFTTAPTAGAVLSWTGQFYWRCRFMDDQMTVSKFIQDFWESRSIKFQSVK